jgi:ABC-type uncharacterized transport system permease subunit
VKIVAMIISGAAAGLAGVVNGAHQFAAVLEKVHMPPASFDGVVDSTRSFADRALEMFSGHVLES